MERSRRRREDERRRKTRAASKFLLAVSALLPQVLYRTDLACFVGPSSSSDESSSTSDNDDDGSDADSTSSAYEIAASLLPAAAASDPAHLANLASLEALTSSKPEPPQPSSPTRSRPQKQQQQQQQKKKQQAANDSDASDLDIDETLFASANELPPPSKAPPLPFKRVAEGQEMRELGRVTSVVGKMCVVTQNVKRGAGGILREEGDVLAEGSVICWKDGRVLGLVSSAFLFLLHAMEALNPLGYFR
jgi:DNA mismatch repair ATPase MutL